MFIGEMMCLVAYAIQPYISRFRWPTDSYEPLNQEDERVSSETVRPLVKADTETEVTTPRPLTGLSKFLFLLPTICDLTGTTLMNVGVIYTPVSIYQMTRGLLVLWVGIFSVIFLRRKLWAYQWVCLVLVTSGVALVGLAGSLVKKAVLPEDEPLTLIKRVAVAIANMAGQEDPTKIFIGVLFIAGAQIFTASQFVSCCSWLAVSMAATLIAVLTYRSSKKRSWVSMLSNPL
jgi:drug/metabolite transporter (DMT)-like permease